jgi:hypothetical protein
MYNSQLLLTHKRILTVEIEAWKKVGEVHALIGENIALLKKMTDGHVSKKLSGHIAALDGKKLEEVGRFLEDQMLSQHPNMDLLTAKSVFPG